MEKIKQVKEKKIFSELPDSIIEKALIISENDVKKTRAFLRKYFGVFLTNKIIKEKFSDEEILQIHKSSKPRNYELLYKKIFEKIQIKNPSILDLGCGANGFSYNYLKEIFSSLKYIGIEASGQIVNSMNKYFEKNNFNAKSICEDILKIEKIEKIIEKEKPNIIFLFNVVDALEKFERDYSKKLINLLFKKNPDTIIIISNPVESLSGKKKFNIKRKWLEKFLKDNYNIIEKFKLGFEEFLITKK